MQTDADSSRMPTHTYVYRAVTQRVIDGDTIELRIDQGMHTYRVERVRLLGVNTPERKGVTFAHGDASRKYTADWLGLHFLESVEWPLLVQTHKSDAFGRWLAYVWRVRDGACLNNDLVRDGMAVVDIR